MNHLSQKSIKNQILLRVFTFLLILSNINNNSSKQLIEVGKVELISIAKLENIESQSN